MKLELNISREHNPSKVSKCHLGQKAPNDTVALHSGVANPVQIVSTPVAPPSPDNGSPISLLCNQPSWIAWMLMNAGHVETNPGPTTTYKQVWICDICHRLIQVRKQISIRCNKI